MQPETHYGYAIKGIQGGLNILQMAVKEGLPISEHWFTELIRCEQRLGDLTTQLESRLATDPEAIQRASIPPPPPGPLNIDK